MKSLVAIAGLSGLTGSVYANETVKSRLDVINNERASLSVCVYNSKSDTHYLFTGQVNNNIVNSILPEVNTFVSIGEIKYIDDMYTNTDRFLYSTSYTTLFEDFIAQVQFHHGNATQPIGIFNGIVEAGGPRHTLPTLVYGNGQWSTLITGECSFNLHAP